MDTMENPPIAAQERKLTNRLEHYLSLTAEYGIYLYVFLSLFDRGEGLRTVGLYGALTGWVILAFFSKRITITVDIIICSFSLFIASTILSSFFSIEPVYSLKALMGDALKSAVTFLIISSFFNTKMLIRLSKVICISGLIILAFGLHRFLLGKMHIYTSKNIFLSLDKNEFGFFVGLFYPFFIMFFFKSNTMFKKGFWGLSSISGIFGTIFSASRVSIGNIFAALAIWAVFMLKRVHIKKVLISAIIIGLLIIISFNFWPELIRRQVFSMPEELYSFHSRTNWFWKPAIEAVKKRPLFGWGCGSKIYRDERPFENSEKPNWALRGGLHSTFISVLFHQGIFGLMSYLLLLLSTTFILFKMALKEKEDKKLLAIALLSIIVGSAFVNSFLLSIPLKRLAPILGMSSALFKNRSTFSKD